ncbi:2OG-Fe(II) oxygenase [Nocardia sp. XZ_19_385]|uniref:2OG-Fe(II) oxygenase n=1 Tax=Nocardia sp. XZ_19_385 TaxID=2769488 RepID=UPI0028162608|nr:2OG-Fe(II) oxygenase [Nocardia sp. XZ_19_385]
MSDAVGTVVAEQDWPAIAVELAEHGHALTGPLLTPGECREIAGYFAEEHRFRTTVEMARHRFGSGRYRYFTHDLPPVVAELRQAFYPNLLPVARDWADKLGQAAPWPDTLDEWIAMCHSAGQRKSAQILLRYESGDWNALHRDLFGDMVFPLQVVIGLDADYTGGEFLMVEQRPRAQSRGYATTVPRGHGLIFTTRDRPLPSARGWSVAPMRHGVSVLRSGTRHTLGLVFHEAT